MSLPGDPVRGESVTVLLKLMALVSQYGAAVLALQDGLRKSMITGERGGSPTVGNFLVISLDRGQFQKEWKGPVEEALDEFRALLKEEAERFVAANGWQFGDPLSINLLLRSHDASSQIRAEHRDHLYRLTLQDDRGTRDVLVSDPTTLLGRAHDTPPRSFISVHDASRSFSREHLLLRFRDLRLHLRLLGANKTEINDRVMEGGEEVILNEGDRIRCGAHTIICRSLAG